MRYEKPIVNVIDLQVKENIAAVNGTVYRGTSSQLTVNSLQLALSEAKTGIEKGTFNEEITIS